MSSSSIDQLCRVDTPKISHAFDPFGEGKIWKHGEFNSQTSLQAGIQLDSFKDPVGSCVCFFAQWFIPFALVGRYSGNIYSSISHPSFFPAWWLHVSRQQRIACSGETSANWVGWFLGAQALLWEANTKIWMAWRAASDAFPFSFNFIFCLRSLWKPVGSWVVGAHKISFMGCSRGRALTTEIWDMRYDGTATLVWWGASGTESTHKGITDIDIEVHIQFQRKP